MTSFAWLCPNCIEEWAEPFCDGCGRNLMTDRALTEPDQGSERHENRESAEHGPTTAPSRDYSADWRGGVSASSGSVSARHLTLVPDSTVSPWLVRLNDIARDDWSRRAS